MTLSQFTPDCTDLLEFPYKEGTLIIPWQELCHKRMASDKDALLAKKESDGVSKMDQAVAFLLTTANGR